MIVFGLMNGDPIDFGGGEAGCVREVVDGRRENKFVLRDPRIDSKRLCLRPCGPACRCIARRVSRGSHRYHRGMIWPGDGGVDGLHAFVADGAFACQAAGSSATARWRSCSAYAGKPSMLITMTWRCLKKDVARMRAGRGCR